MAFDSVTPQSVSDLPTQAAQCSCAQHANSITITQAIGKAIAAKRAVVSAVKDLESAIADLKHLREENAPQV